MKFEKALPYDINISSSSNMGYIVKVGCSVNVFTNKNDLLVALQEYIDNPKKVEKEYNESFPPPPIGYASQVTEANNEERNTHQPMDIGSANSF